MNNPHRLTKADLDTVRISRHAREVMARRAIAEVDVARTLVNGSSHPHKGLRRYILGDLCVVFAPDDRVVVTVLLFTEERWTDEDARRR
ncbi:hypothetical protein SEA_BARNSTORMER_56 [Microbacterium phage Barnstormer]|uniref:DUF4258 domain-containing protein n=1 Tax=Microbacterium phage Barnstormer TaxID=3028491 RepID=A0AAE9ZJI8_9CAUD|nr:hypothetical protein SEA_BARNSTORMER_56 [Microbacterium phage Barnstormer]WDS52162.1 hypothetical protein SEA_UTZCHIPS_56 [Microbacterium phage UtzChips]